jgi:hypothetical protein
LNEREVNRVWSKLIDLLKVLAMGSPFALIPTDRQHTVFNDYFGFGEPLLELQGGRLRSTVPGERLNGVADSADASNKLKQELAKVPCRSLFNWLTKRVC